MVDIYEKLAELKKENKDAVIVTVISKEGMGPADVGKKMIVTYDNVAYGTVGGGSLEYFAREKCKEILKRRESLSENYILNDKNVSVDNGEVVLNMACGGKVTLFYEFIGPKQHVYIFGAGHCGNELAKLLKPLGFHVTLIDSRKEVLDNAVSVDEKVLSNFKDYVSSTTIPNDRYLVVSTPSHIEDFDVLDKIFELGIKPKYFGMLCSKKKIVDYMNRIYEKYGKDIDLSNFYSPIGLQTGGDSPEEVAISIAGEILSVYYNKSDINSHMRDNVPSEVKYFKK